MAKERARPGRPDAHDPDRVGPVQQAVMLAIRDHPSNAYGVGISRRLRREFDPDIADAQVYVAMRRLESRNLISEMKTLRKTAEPSSGRKGRPHKLYSLTVSGKRALERGDAQFGSSNTDTRRKTGRAQTNVPFPSSPALVG